MEYGLLAVTALSLYVQNIFRKNFTQKSSNSAAARDLFNGLTSLTALVFFDVVRRLNHESFDWHAPTMLFGAAFAVCFALCLSFTNRSMETGPLGLTSLIVSYSLIIPTVYGLLAFGETLSWLLAVGLVCLFISLYLVNPKKQQGVIQKGWFVFVAITAVSNGLCSVIQTGQQHRFGSEFRFEMLEWSMVFSALFNLAAFAWHSFHRAHDAPGKNLFCGMLNAPLCGLANGTLNFLIITLAGRLPSSLLFPTVSAASLILTVLSSKLFYRETYSFKQYGGFLLGVVSIVLMNL